VLLFHFTGVSTKRTDRQNCCIYIARQCADARQKLSKIDLVQIEHCQEVGIVEFVAAFSSCAWKIFGYQVYKMCKYKVAQLKPYILRYHVFLQVRADFQNSYTRYFVRKFSMYVSQRFPPHLQYVATLPCESRESKNVTKFSR